MHEANILKLNRANRRDIDKILYYKVEVTHYQHQYSTTHISIQLFSQMGHKGQFFNKTTLFIVLNKFIFIIVDKTYTLIPYNLVTYKSRCIMLCTYFNKFMVCSPHLYVMIKCIVVVNFIIRVQM